MKIDQRVIQNIIGKKKKGKDTDGDRILNKKDCQPNNTMRQDRITTVGLTKLKQNIDSRRFLEIGKQKTKEMEGKI